VSTSHIEGCTLASRRSVLGPPLHPLVSPSSRQNGSCLPELSARYTLLARFGGKHEGGSERHVHVSKGWVWALHRPRPEPGDHSEPLTHIFLQVWSLCRHRGCHFGLRVKVNRCASLPRLASTSHNNAHPREALGALPCLIEKAVYHSLLRGFTGGLPANMGGISIMALFISTATGFRSLA